MACPIILVCWLDRQALWNPAHINILNLPPTTECLAGDKGAFRECTPSLKPLPANPLEAEAACQHLCLVVTAVVVTTTVATTMTTIVVGGMVTGGAAVDQAFIDRALQYAALQIGAGGGVLMLRFAWAASGTKVVAFGIVTSVQHSPWKRLKGQWGRLLLHGIDWWLNMNGTIHVRSISSHDQFECEA
jgi:hypothetical protein